MKPLTKSTAETLDVAYSEWCADIDAANWRDTVVADARCQCDGSGSHAAADHEGYWAEVERDQEVA